MGTNVWKIGGPAGFGIMKAGQTFAKMLKRCGFYVHGYPEYPSIVRGGYNSFQIAFSKDEVFAPYRKADILVVLDKVVFDNEEIEEDMIVVADFDNVALGNDIRCKKINIPFASLLKENGFPTVVKNTIALGVSVKLLNLDLEPLLQLFKEEFDGEVFDVNVEAVKIGYSACEAAIETEKNEDKKSFLEKLVLTGNQAVSLGALKAGLGFYSAYPMTPASSILHYLAEVDREYGLIVKHTEDEISAVMMAIGASYTGVRAMTGTSGGGLSLMAEGIGLAAMTETPLVIFLSQRPGPATGMPTWTEQADLKFVMNISQDEFVRAVFTPGDVDELYRCTFEAFNIADQFQIPVFILSDKFLSESLFCTEPFDDEDLRIERGEIFVGNNENPMEFYPRYRENGNGIPMKVYPGTPGGLYKASGTEHDEYGFVTIDSKIRIKNQDRRFKKEEVLKEIMPLPKIYGRDDAEITFVCWGSTKLSLLEAMKYSDRFNFIHFSAVYPLDWDKVKDILKDKNLVIMESNFTAQLGSIIKEKTGIAIEKSFLKYDGRPFFVEEILTYVEKR